MTPSFLKKSVEIDLIAIKKEENENGNMEVDIELDGFTDAQFLDVLQYNVRDITLVFDAPYLHALMGEKLTEVGHFINDIPYDHSIKVNEIEYDKDLKKYTLSTTLQKALIN